VKLLVGFGYQHIVFDGPHVGALVEALASAHAVRRDYADGHYTYTVDPMVTVEIEFIHEGRVLAPPAPPTPVPDEPEPPAPPPTDDIPL